MAGKNVAKASDTKTELAETKTTAVAEATFSMASLAEDAGVGMEGATAESFAIPFLSVLQKGSPQVDETVDGGAHIIPGAKAGTLFENISQKIVDGKAGVQIVPCAYKRTFITWGARENGGGFKGERSPEAVAEMREAGDLVEQDGRLYIPLSDGSVNPKKCDQVKDTRNHYVLILDENGGWTEALMSLTSTQIKKSKILMSNLASVKVRGENGQMFTPPTFSNIFSVTSLAESNDKGSWYGVKFDRVGAVDRREIYEAAKRFHATVKSGLVSAKYEDSDAEAGSDKI